MSEEMTLSRALSIYFSQAESSREGWRDAEDEIWDEAEELMSKNSKTIFDALKLQELVKGDRVTNLKSLIHSITKCAGDYDEIHAKRYEEEIFAFLDEIETTLKENVSNKSKIVIGITKILNILDSFCSILLMENSPLNKLCKSCLSAKDDFLLYEKDTKQDSLSQHSKSLA